MEALQDVRSAIEMFLPEIKAQCRQMLESRPAIKLSPNQLLINRPLRQNRLQTHRLITIQLKPNMPQEVEFNNPRLVAHQRHLLDNLIPFLPIFTKQRKKLTK